ncbi:MAG TPA: FixH family protein [Pyrinomonadaceae bacterium]|jgi:predicted small secreted protein|nr:FixH family protein [Pyrinomonadaceae bacterium]
MKRITIVLVFLATAVVLAACGSGTDSAAVSGKVIKSGPAGNNLTAAISNSDGVLRKGRQEFMLTFADAKGAPVDVGAVSLNFFMPAMGSMSAMNNPATFTTTGTPGIYAGKAEIEMTGEWQAQISYEGPAGKGKFAIPVSAQ